MKRSLVLVLSCLSTLGGCASARLYPVKGPLSQQKPVPVYQAKISQAGVIPSGSFSAVLDNGEVCKGKWKLVFGTKAPKPAAPGADPSMPDLAADWDTVYGTNYYSLKAVGTTWFMRGVATGNRGTILNLEMFMDESHPGPGPADDSNVFREMAGVARDNKGNLYKLAFR
jgi:hypothetical protein